MEDESGQEFEVKYIQGRWGLSGGWRTFAMEHKLLEGDVLIFQLVEPNRLKVSFEVVRFVNGSDVQYVLCLYQMKR